MCEVKPWSNTPQCLIEGRQDKAAVFPIWEE